MSEEESEYFEMVHSLFTIPSIVNVIGDPHRSDFLYTGTQSGIPLLYRWSNGESECITPGDEPITGTASLHKRKPWVIFGKDKKGTLNYDLYLLDYSTHKLTQITRGGIGRLARLFWTTDESWIVVGCDRESFYIRSVTEKGLQKNIFSSDQMILADYDEKRNFFVATVGEGPGTRIALIDSEGHITDWISESEQSEDFSPQVSPEKGYFVYMTDVSGSKEIVVRSLDTLEVITRAAAPGDIVFLRAAKNQEAVFAAIAKDAQLSPYVLTFDGKWCGPLVDMSVNLATFTKDGCVWIGSSFSQPDCIQSYREGNIHTLVQQDYTGQCVAGESHWYTSFDGRRIQGWLLRSKAKDAPLVVVCHGGPTSAVLNMWSTGLVELVLAGYHVFAPNFRGSATFGPEFKNLNIGDIGGGDCRDIVYGSKYAQKILGITGNPFVVGLSYGGYLTLQALTTQPDAWAGGVALIPTVDYSASYALADAADRSFISYFFGGTPQEKPELYRERSPITHVGRLRSPVLIIAGENDPICPLQPIKEFYSRAQELNLPVELEIIKGEGHVPARTSNAIRAAVLELEFLKKLR